MYNILVDIFRDYAPVKSYYQMLFLFPVLCITLLYLTYFTPSSLCLLRPFPYFICPPTPLHIQCHFLIAYLDTYFIGRSLYPTWSKKVSMKK